MDEEIGKSYLEAEAPFQGLSEEPRKDSENLTNGLWHKCQPKNLFPGKSMVIGAAHFILVVSLLYLVLLLLLGDLMLPPHGKLFQLFSLIVAALILGSFVGLMNLPPLLGMLLAGALFRNFGFYDLAPDYVVSSHTKGNDTVDSRLAGDVYSESLLDLRKVALAVILIKAGLYLNPKSLHQQGWVVVRLAFCPCCVEALAAAAGAYLLLNMPILWGLLLGFSISAVSPAILVPSLMRLQKLGYGSEEVHTVGIAASTIDDILAISAFGIISGLIFQEGTLLEDVIKVPFEIIVGVVSGVGYGLLLLYIPHHTDKNLVLWRVVLLFIGSIVALFGSEALGYEGVGPLVCLVASFVAAAAWSAAGENAQSLKGVTSAFTGLWFVFEPVLFSLIGAEIVFARLTSELMVHSLVVIGFALSLRFAAAFAVTSGSVFSLKERLFVAIAWMPKASVQGLLGPLALEMAIKTFGNNISEEVLARGENILNIAVLSILLTAPFGAVAIRVAGNRLLELRLNLRVST